EILEIQKPYIKKTSSLNYASISSRLNITFTVNKLYKSNVKPINYYNYVMRYLFKYLINNPNLGLLLGG
ncbi:hypothetical protein QBC45DRAFT_292032, partial [Copromyces sp. CBS 386.78]